MSIINFSPSSLCIRGPNGNHELIDHFTEIEESTIYSDTNETSLSACKETFLT